MARLSSQVAARRADLEHLCMADLHGARFRARGLLTSRTRVPETATTPASRALLWYAAIAAARWRVSRSGSALGGPWRMTWLPGIPRI
jgi:hypothetical protein